MSIQSQLSPESSELLRGMSMFGQLKTRWTPEIDARWKLCQPDDIPSVYWHTKGKQWSSKIGYVLLPTTTSMPAPGRRDRACQYFGNDQSEEGTEQAKRKAFLIRFVWEGLVRAWPEFRKGADCLAPQYDWSKPVWPDCPLVKDVFLECQRSGEANVQRASEWMQKSQQLLLRVGRDTHERVSTALNDLRADGGNGVRQLLGAYVPPALAVQTQGGVTIEQAAERFLESRMKKVALMKGKKINANTFNEEKRRLRLAMAGLPDHTKPMNSLTKSDLESFINHWWAEGGNRSRRTAKNYCLSVYSMFKWAAEEEDIEFTMPKGAADMFRFPNVNPINIAKYDAEKLVAIRRHSTPQLYLYELLGLAGMYQVDIAHLRFGEVHGGKLRYFGSHGDLKGEIVKLDDGEVVPLTYEEIKKYNGKYDIYVYRLRDRTEHKVDPRNKSLVWLFPEAGKLLARFLAPKDNPYGYCLLDSAGRPLLQTEIGLARHDAIGPQFAKVVAEVKSEIETEGKTAGLSDEDAAAKAERFHFSFKQFRKVGSTAVASLAKNDSDAVVRLYRSQPPEGDAKFYVSDDFEKKLTPVLKQWAKKLRADKVLVNDPAK